jgi:osmotically-inducible protein OsmY
MRQEEGEGAGRYRRHGPDYERQVAALNEPSVRSPEIDVEATNGAVKLSGFVTGQADINRAVEVAWGVKGVKSVKIDMRGNGRQIDSEA